MSPAQQRANWLVAAANHLGQATKVKPARRELLRMRLIDEAIDFTATSVSGAVYQAIMADVKRIVGWKKKP